MGGPSEKVKSSQFIEDAINEEEMEEVLMKNENLEDAAKEEQ